MKSSLSEQYLSSFVKNLGVEKATWFGGANIFLTPATKTPLIIKVSTEGRNWWGIANRVLNKLDAIGAVSDDFRSKGYNLLLLDSDKTGWVYSKREIYQKIETGVWILAKDNNYKINRNDIDIGNRFYDLNEIQEKIIN